MFKKTALYAQTLVLLIAVAVVVHYLTGLDWPWAIVAGAAVSLAARALIPVAARVLTHAHLLRTVWGPAQERQIDYLRVAIRALRQKLERDPARPQIIINEPAVGYRLIAA